MPIEDPIESTLQLSFETERLSRVIQDCEDITTLREIAMQLLHIVTAFIKI